MAIQVDIEDLDNDAYFRGLDAGKQLATERIIKLLEQQYDNCDENGKCIYLKHMPECCNCDLIALIKGEE